MSTIQRVVLVTSVLLFGTVVLAAGRAVSEVRECFTSEHVQQYLENSRNGISLTCNEEIRRRNVERAAVAQH